MPSAPMLLRASSGNAYKHVMCTLTEALTAELVEPSSLERSAFMPALGITTFAVECMATMPKEVTQSTQADLQAAWDQLRGK